MAIEIKELHIDVHVNSSSGPGPSPGPKNSNAEGNEKDFCDTVEAEKRQQFKAEILDSVKEMIKEMDER